MVRINEKFQSETVLSLRLLASESEMHLLVEIRYLIAHHVKTIEKGKELVLWYESSVTSNDDRGQFAYKL